MQQKEEQTQRESGDHLVALMGPQSRQVPCQVGVGPAEKRIFINAEYRTLQVFCYSIIKRICIDCCGQTCVSGAASADRALGI